jgi:hypothetical protein
MLQIRVGFYLRKSVSVGPFRFNLSKSGLGLSTGIKGFRVGTGPRGNYVQMGRGGICFRQTLLGSHNQKKPSESPRIHASNINFVEFDSGNVSQMVDSSSAALLQEIDSKAKKSLIWPWVLAFSVGSVALFVALHLPIWAFCLLLPFCAAALAWTVRADELRKTIVLFYDLAPHIEEAYQTLHHVFDSLRGCARVWHIDSRGRITTTYDWKVNAGASAVVKRNGIKPRVGAPSYFQCNISIPMLPAGRQRLYFLPDRILVWDTNGVGAIAFDKLDLNFGERPFIEDGGVPPDSRVIDKTWRYVNKSGGPDRRFNNNREIPIVLYEELLLTSRSGLQELFQLSRTGLGIQLKAALKQMAVAISDREELKKDEGYIKCPCKYCDIFIEFPAHGLGQVIACPHCGMQTVLFKPGSTAR